MGCEVVNSLGYCLCKMIVAVTTATFCLSQSLSSSAADSELAAENRQ